MNPIMASVSLSTDSPQPMRDGLVEFLQMHHQQAFDEVLDKCAARMYGTARIMEIAA